MFRNYFKIAWRHLWRNKVFSAITIFGLSLAIVSALLIIFHVREELSYDRKFSKADRIFRITQEELGEDARHWAATSPPLGSAMQEAFPEVEQMVRFQRPYPSQVFSFTPSKGEVKRFEEKGGFFADSNVVDIFDLVFIRGNAKTALATTNAIILTEELAKKYFGEEDPLDKTLVDDRRKLPLKVTGVIKSFPFSTHLRFDYLLSMSTINNYQDKESLESRSWNGFYTYVLIDKNAKKEKLEAKLPDFIAGYYEKSGKSRQEILATRTFHFQPITAIHLHSKLEKEMYANSDITYVYIFSLAALFILFVAAINFINISTAQAFNRMKEIGLRKVVGSTRGQLIKQFLGESFFVTLVATIIALFLFKWAMPFYNNLTGKHFQPGQIVTLSNISLLLLLVITIGLLSGLYPAWFVSRFNPILSLKGKKANNASVNNVRKGLIVFQFVVAVFMIFSTITIYRQMQLFHNKDLGFDKEQLIAVTMYEGMWPSYSALTTEMQKNKAIANHSILSTLPGERFSMQSFTPIGTPDDEDIPGTRTMWADENLLPTLGVSLKEGRNFFNQFPDIKKQEFILNETAVKTLQLKDPIGKRFVLDRDTGDVVGIIKDFNFASLHSTVEPMVIQYNPYRANYLLIKVRPGQLKPALQFLTAQVKTLSPSSVFNYTFIDDKLNLLYESENRMSIVFKIFAAFALVISCLGLFGLSAYAARLRIKEVGIRKVLGATLSNIMLLLSRDFIKLVLLAVIIALPLGWWAMTKWLEGFAYHISIGWWVFAVTGVVALLIAVITVSFQVVRAAVANPVKSLRTE